MESPATGGCLSLAEIEDHVAGGRRDPDVERHLDSCPRCRESLGTVVENNALFERVASATRAGAGLPGIDPPALGDVPGYEILGEVHRGGQGVVYRATQRSTNRPVALKMLLHGSLSTTRQRWRFEREIEMVAALRHPAIVTVYESGVTSAGHPYYSMELVEGAPLDLALPRLESTTPGEPRRALVRRRLRLFLRVCEAVSFAHRRAVIHRDLKPSNVLVDDEDRPHVLDFGVAKALDEELGPERTVPGEFMGTLAYAAPEQITGDPTRIDVRSDVYALGVILFQLLTDRRPFEPGASIAETVRQATESLPPAPSSIGAGADAELDAVVLKALEKAPEERYQSAGDLADDVRRYLAGQPLQAKRDRTWYVIRKLARRHVVPLSAGAGVVAALIAIAISMTFLYRRAQVEASKSNVMRVFLEDTLGSVPESPDKAETTLRTVLDEASQWVDIALSDQPEIAAAMRLTIGNSYRNLGLFQRAEHQMIRALEARRALLGPRHPDTATCLNTLGLLCTDQGDFDRAEALLHEALDIRSDHFGPRHLVTAMSHMNIARLERARGRPGHAERALRTCLSIRTERLGAEHPDAAMCRFQLAGILADTGRLDEAERTHRLALAARQASLPQGHPDLARSHQALAGLLTRRGLTSEAERHMRRAADLLHETFGPDHPASRQAAQQLRALLSPDVAHP